MRPPRSGFGRVLGAARPFGYERLKRECEWPRSGYPGWLRGYPLCEGLAALVCASPLPRSVGWALARRIFGAGQPSGATVGIDGYISLRSLALAGARYQ